MPGRGAQGYEEAKNYLTTLVSGKQVQLEYDAYQDDKFGRILAYAWIPCIEDIIAYCRGDKALVNEIMIKKGYAKKVVYEKRKKLRYDEYLNQ